MVADDTGAETDAHFVQELYEELTRLRRYGLRRLPRHVKLPRLEYVALAVSPAPGTPLEARLKAALEAGARHLPGAYGEAMADLLDFAPDLGKSRVESRRRSAVSRVGGKYNYFKNTLEKRTLKELAGHLARLAHEQPPQTVPEPHRADPEPTERPSPLDRRIAPPVRLGHPASILLIAALVVVSALALSDVLTSASSIPTAELARLATESEQELTGDQAPAPGDVSRTLGFGDPSPQGRTVYPYVAYRAEQGAPAQKTPASPTPSLDVLTDAPGVSDERRFLQVITGRVTPSRPDGNIRRSAFVRGNEPVRLWLYVDNGAAPEPNCASLTGATIARHTTVRVAIWDSPNKRLHIIRAWVFAENTQPTWITDAVAVVTEHGGTLQLTPSLSSQYSESPTYRSRPPLTSSAIIEPGGMSLGGDGLLGSCWQNRFVLFLTFHQN
jgi:hypothetical protein